MSEFIQEIVLLQCALSHLVFWVSLSYIRFVHHLVNTVSSFLFQTFFKFQNLFPAQPEDNERSHEPDDAAHTYIHHEVLREVDPGVAAQRSKKQHQQQRRMKQYPCPEVVLLGSLYIMIGQDDGATGKEHEEG